MHQDNLISTLLVSAADGERLASLAWRCRSCGRVTLHDQQVPPPAQCGDCGQSAMQAIDGTNLTRQEPEAG
jgi:hypothetical protein